MKDSTIFARQSFIDLSGAIGHVYAGRMFSLSGDTGVAGFYGSILSPFGTGWGTHNGYGEVQKYQARFNNTVVYVSTKFAGTEILAQYSMGDSDDNKSSNDRYAALGFRSVTGGLTWGMLADWLNKKSYYSDGTTYRSDDAWTFNIGGNYDCGAARTYLAFQYFRDLDDLSGVISNNISDWDTGFMVSNGLTIDGFGLSAGVSIPALGDEVKFMAGYMDGSSNGEAYDFDVSTWTVFAGYLYRFTRRTHAYAGAGYVERKPKVRSGAAADCLGTHREKQTEIVCGLVHTF